MIWSKTQWHRPEALLSSAKRSFRTTAAPKPSLGVDMDILDIVSGTDEAAFAVDHEGRIGAWNAAISRLVGVKESEALGRLCHRVICGTDSFGNRYCGTDCPVQRMARRQEPIHRFRLNLQTAYCQYIQAWVTIIVLPRSDHSEFDLVHVLSLITKSSRRPKSSSNRSRRADASAPPSQAQRYAAMNRRLTRRELEILRLLAAGEGTKEISELLFISSHTVRNHIQSILSKLGVHSRLEAVSCARRRRLI